MHKHLLVILLVVLTLSGAYIVGRHDLRTAPNRPTHPVIPITSTGRPPAPPFNMNLHSLTDPTSLWVIVNKQHPLNPSDYVPSNLVIPDIPLRSNITSTEKYLRTDTANELRIMADAAKQQGITLNLQSGYRSYSFQVTLYASYVAQQSQAQADQQSARPGYSEHQTGLAADLGGISEPNCNVAQCFANTVEGQWLAANAYRYGFIIRYPDGQQSVTGYEYEPWHVRYVGTALSTEMHDRNVLTLEAFFGLPAAPNYN